MSPGWDLAGRESREDGMAQGNGHAGEVSPYPGRGQVFKRRAMSFRSAQKMRSPSQDSAKYRLLFDGDGASYGRLIDSLSLPAHGKSSGEPRSVMI